MTRTSFSDGKIFCEILSSFIGVTGESPKVIIRRTFATEYWNGSGWQGTPYENTMTAFDATTYPGLYVFDVGKKGDPLIVRCKNTGTYAFDDYAIMD
jgi:hypothetical protein